MVTDGGIATVENSLQTFWQDPNKHKLAYHVCKEFLRLLPTPLYLGHPHNIHLECVTSEYWTCTLSELVTLWAFPGHSMSIVFCLPCSKYTDLIHHTCLWYTCCTIVSKICLWICAGWHTYTPRNCITALWSCLDKFTTSCGILSYAAMPCVLSVHLVNCTVLPKCLPVCYWVKHAAVPFTLSQQGCEWVTVLCASY